MKKVIAGIVAHVDAGKTTLSESLLFLSGKIRQMGRVDNKDAYLDTFELEKERGITIFAKQAILNFKTLQMTLLDTPGHIDFSAEMERTLQVLDYAILVVSGADGVQGHTKTLWQLLRTYHIPVFIFVNKMDQSGTEEASVLESLRKHFGDGCIPFNTLEQNDIQEQIAMTSEVAMEAYLSQGKVSQALIQSLIASRSLFPVYFGSALKQVGVEAFVSGLETYMQAPQYGDAFGARIFKISRDASGNRLTHLKVTGGRLEVRDLLKGHQWEEKVTQIRLYSGEKFEAAPMVSAGEVCVVTGLSASRPGEGLGFETQAVSPILQPVLSYKVEWPDGVDPKQMMPKLRLLEEELPELKLEWIERHQELMVQVMGEVQLEILQALIKERYDLEISFGGGSIVYKESIEAPVVGVGHFEPLRHYAEVHLLIEPAPRGSGILLDSLCSEDVLDSNYQNLVLTHLKEKTHSGVLTGSEITDLKISLVNGRAHEKHTEGGDFREATYRALRQGLKAGQSILLEPYYDFTLELPSHLVGKAMTDIDQMSGTCELNHTDGETAILTGYAPVSQMRHYHNEVIAYSKGYGRLTTSVRGYEACHNAQAVIEAIGYDSERDVLNPTGSIFCAQGSGYLVPWDEVTQHMHLENYWKPRLKQNETPNEIAVRSSSDVISLEEIDEIMNSTVGRNQGKKEPWKKKASSVSRYYQSLSTPKTHAINLTGKPYLLVDGYNVIFAWPELKAVADKDLEDARIKLLEMMSHYRGVKQTDIIVVFDAYRVAGRKAAIERYKNIDVVFTGEAQTADQYIEKFAHDHKKDYKITVATSDNLQQVIIRGAGSLLMSSRELMMEVETTLAELRRNHVEGHQHKKVALSERLDENTAEQLEAMKATMNQKKD